MLLFQSITSDTCGLLAKLCKDTFVQAYKDVHEPHNIKAYCDEHFSFEAVKRLVKLKNFVGFIASDQAQTAGFYTLKHHSCSIPLDGRATELKQIYVLARYYGTGAGQEIFDHLTSVAANAGSDWLWLSVSSVNYRAQKFYAKLGFDKIGQGKTLRIGEDQLESYIFARKII